MAYVGMHTDQGRVKTVDQDACCYLEASTTAGRVIMALICDGVGGLSKGELASTTVIHRFERWFSESLPMFISFNRADAQFFESVQNVWDTLLQTACGDIYGYGEREGVTLGTTFTGMIVFGNRYLIGHVGDCRAYEIADGSARQLTADQTLVAQQVAAGIITPEQAVKHPKRNVILQSVGTHESVEPEFVVGELNSQATYLLCCDGFYNKLSADELGRGFTPSTFATEEGLRQMCARYVEGVLNRGEKDNVTVLAFTEAFDEGARAQLQMQAQMQMQAAASSMQAPDQQQTLFGQPIRIEPVPAPMPDGSDTAIPEFSDDEESPTIVVDEEDSPTIVVQGGDA